MTGYQEAVTDPSFAEQIVCFTAPMVGNYGVADERARVGRGRTRGRCSCARRAGRRGPTGCASTGVVALSGIDTRSLVLHLRDAGAMRAIAVSGDCSRRGGASPRAASSPSMAGRALVAGVSTREPYVFERRGRVRIAVVDYGCKRSILRRLAEAGAAVTVYPHDATRTSSPATTASCSRNGPGDPEPLADEVETVRELLGRDAGARHLPRPPAARRSRPGTRPSSSRSATAARTTRCSTRRTGRVLVTSQNHGFAVARERRRRGDARLALRRHRRGARRSPSSRARSVQFHPEAGPGPHDAWPLLERLGRGGDRHAAGATTSSSICLIGSGPIVIGQACEFDYAGCQALQGAARGRLPDDRRQLEPGDDHDRPRLRRPHVPRAARRRGRRRGARARAARRAAADDGRPDGAQPRARAGDAGDARRARDRADRRAPLDAIERAEDRELFREAVRSRAASRCPTSRDRHARSTSSRASRSPRSCGPAFTLGGHGGGFAYTRGRADAGRSRSACARARSARCSSRSRCAAGTSSSSR